MSDMTLIIGNRNYSSWSLRPWIFMKHYHIEFDEKRIALFTETTDEELAEYNSDFKVPVLKDGDQIIWDSLAILEYVSEKYLESGGWPKDVDARAMARSVSCEMHSSFFNVRNEMPMNCRKSFHDIKLSPEASREVERIIFLWDLCRNRYGEGGEWLFGRYSIADAMFAPIALRFKGYNIALDGTALRYVESVLHHPDIIDWIEAGKIEKEVIGEDEIEM